MPTYVYACRGCEDRTEIVQRMSDPALTDCARCGGILRRVLFPPAIVYKGSGFYTTDYKNSGRKSESEGAPATGDSKTDGKTEATSEGKSETKAETKSETRSEPKSETKSEAKTGS